MRFNVILQAFIEIEASDLEEAEDRAAEVERLCQVWMCSGAWEGLPGDPRLGYLPASVVAEQGDVFRTTKGRSSA